MLLKSLNKKEQIAKISEKTHRQVHSASRSSLSILKVTSLSVKLLKLDDKMRPKFVSETRRAAF